MKEERTIPDLAKDLRQMAELTARMSQNWDNLEDILRSALQQTYDAGRARGQ